MATKNISITEDAYSILTRRKIREKESFSEVIIREFGSKEKLRKLFGILKGKEGEEFERNWERVRKAREIANERRIERIKMPSAKI